MAVTMVSVAQTLQTDNDAAGAMQSSVTGTAGPVGAAFAVRARTWTCPACKAKNPPQHKACNRCRKKMPRDSAPEIVWHQGATLAAAGADHHWREALDQASKQIYYYNEKSGVTQWERPKEMGETVRNTGWYGRGRAGEQSRLDKKNAEYLKRPAAKQIEAEPKETAYLQGAEMFNKWYGKFTGDQLKEQRMDPAKHRCKLDLHAGYTRADKQGGEGAFFCMYFAQGECPKGKACRFYHRIPTYADVGRLERDAMRDVFGRERHATHRDDMRGAGSFKSPSRTLYVGRLLRAAYDDSSKALREALQRHFSEWGEVESINLVWKKSIAFVRYRFRSHAEFALLAMANQQLDKEEVLDVKWAHEDPNPVAQEAMRRSNADAMVAAIRAAGHHIEDTVYQLPADYAPSSAASSGPAQIADDDAPAAASADAAPQIADAPAGATTAAPGTALYYPNTDAQYVDAAQGGSRKKQRIA